MRPIQHTVLCTVALCLALAPMASAATPSSYIPADAEQVMFVNVQDLLKSKIVKAYGMKKIKSALENNKESKAFFEAINMDPLKDVHTAFLTNTGDSGKKVLIVLSGKFDAQRIALTAQFLAKKKPEEMKITQTNNRAVYELIKNGDSVWASLVDDKTLVVSPVKKYVLGAVGGTLGKPDAKLVAAIQQVDQKRNLWWAGVVTNEIRELLKNQRAGAPFAQRLVAVTGGMTVTTGIDTQLQVHTTDPQSAQLLGNFMTQAKGILQFAAASNEEIAPAVNALLKTLKIQARQKVMSLGFSLDEEVVEKLVELIPEAEGN